MRSVAVLLTVQLYLISCRHAPAPCNLLPADVWDSVTAADHHPVNPISAGLIGCTAITAGTNAFERETHTRSPS